MQKWAEIRRRVLTGEISERGACREYDIHWETLEKILTFTEPPGYRKTKPRGSKLDPFLPIIEEILKADKKVGATSNFIARTRRKPASVMLVPGLLLLVPGSVGFKSIIDLLDQEPMRSFESAFTMVLIAASIVTGLILANVVVPQSTPKQLKCS